MSKGISNFQIENAIKNTGDEDLDDNFVGVNFNNHAAMISEKQGKYPFIKAVHTGERQYTLVEYTRCRAKNRYFFL